MKQLKPLLLIVGLSLFSCNDVESQKKIRKTPSDSSSTLNDFAKIQDLIRNVYTWHDNENPTRIGMISDLRDSMYIGYNLVELDLATQDLEESDFFTEEFIENYASIHLAVDKKLKRKEIEWLVGSLPNFGSGVEPWCNCQDVPLYAANSWNKIEIKTISLTNNEGTFYWKWGGLRTNMDSNWGAHKYYFRVKKVDGKWKVSYLEGLILEDFI